MAKVKVTINGVEHVVDEAVAAALAAKAGGKGGRKGVKVNRLDTMYDRQGKAEQGKGNLSIFTGSRFPTTLYLDQYRTLQSMAEDIEAAIKANSDAGGLATEKGQTAVVKHVAPTAAMAKTALDAVADPDNEPTADEIQQVLAMLRRKA